MKQAIYAEFRKLFTVRSTYIVLFINLFFVVLIGFYVDGFKSLPPYTDPRLLDGIASSIVGIVAWIAAVSAVLIVAHEYRYNTITYSLTSSRSRSFVLLAKVITVSLFAVVVGIMAAVLTPLLTFLALQIRHAPLIHQQLDIFGLLWRVTLTAWAYTMYGLIFAFITRSIVASIIGLFLTPVIVEQILGLVLKGRQVYLPFAALGNVLQTRPAIPYGRAAITVLMYVIVGLVISWILFRRRDAN